MKENFRKTAKVTLILVYLVIVAGAVVRMTGSGMGCPDWPKCFGHYIPPTEISELQWHSEMDVKKGQIIIVNETLKVAKANFTTNENYNEQNWLPYTKHKYAEFNATHTWIEYINRLCGALAGLGTFILAILSFSFWKTHKSITLISWLTVFAMGFQGWLGATVVYSVLEPAKITIHMIMALIIVALLIYLVFKSKAKNATDRYSKKLNTLLGIALFLTLIQIALGTQVRQFVDEQIDIVGYTAKNLWLQNASIQFYFHRTFSIIVVLLNSFILYRIRKDNLSLSKINWVILLIGLEIVTGIFMYYWDFPFSTQAIHLVLASILFGIQFYLLLEALNTRKSNKTL
ncbi:heme A synthase [Kriegella sp. EG-1]|nr:heme A synthase [Flavobacteriaceae bacterium EG-1]